MLRSAKIIKKYIKNFKKKERQYGVIQKCSFIYYELR
jgi:hypothetical protein